MSGVVAVLVAAVVGTVIVRQHDPPRPVPLAALRVARQVPGWVLGSTVTSYGQVSSATAGECSVVTVDGRIWVPPLLLRSFPGTHARSVLETIDEAAQLCLVQATTADRHGAVFVLRSVPSWDVSAPALRAAPATSSQVIAGRTVSFAVAISHRRAFVAAEWCRQDPVPLARLDALAERFARA